MGTSVLVRDQGRLQSTHKTTVLEILDKRARRWSNRYTFSDDQPHARTTRSFVLAQEEQESIENIHDSLLEVHGDPPPSKPNGVCRVLYENVNGLNNRMANNHKLNKAKQIIHDLEADVVAYNEHRLNLSHKKNDLPAVAGNVHATGNEIVTAQTGGIPG